MTVRGVRTAPVTAIAPAGTSGAAEGATTGPGAAPGGDSATAEVPHPASNPATSVIHARPLRIRIMRGW
ncbi:hypothetical protein GCM10009836_29330 [Pseudonocardia ailaonensis]|uniref:Uncharacterized protein n=1 Tax=Pseudonocardia ailaonensis TaxID=367279 RepID=A0ABN2N402_9PSEU